MEGREGRGQRDRQMGHEREEQREIKEGRIERRRKDEGRKTMERRMLQRHFGKMRWRGGKGEEGEENKGWREELWNEGDRKEEEVKRWKGR